MHCFTFYGSIHIPAVLNSFSSKQLCETAKEMSLIFKNGESDIDDIKALEIIRAFNSDK